MSLGVVHHVLLPALRHVPLTVHKGIASCRTSIMNSRGGSTIAGNAACSKEADKF